jgi:RNA polymerase sigma factor (sigma-70 family)
MPDGKRKRRKLTRKQQELAADAVEYIPQAVRAFTKCYPGVHAKLARIDAVGVAHLAIVRAARTYDSGKSKPNTYFTAAIFNALLKEIGRETRHGYGSPRRVPLETAESELAPRQQLADVAAAVAALREEDRRLVVARYVSNCTYEEMAEEHGCDRRTVRRKLVAIVKEIGLDLGFDPELSESQDP